MLICKKFDNWRDLQRLFETSNPAPILLSPNVKAQTKEKSDEIVFKKPRTPQKTTKLDMDIPGLAPIGDIDIELCKYQIHHQINLKHFHLPEITIKIYIFR